MENIKNYIIDRDIQYEDRLEFIRFKTNDIQFKITNGSRGYSIEAQNTIDESRYAIFSSIPGERNCIKEIKYIEEALKCDSE